MRKTSFAILSFFLCLSGTAQADDDSEFVVVTATRTTQPVEKTGESLTVLTESDLERQQTVAISDALSLTPAAIVVRNGGLGQNATVSLRGAEAGQSLILIDGVRINDPSSVDDEALLGDVLANNIDRIEILRGPQSTLYGSAAIGGVVNILTRRGGEMPMSLRASAEGGSFGTYHVNAGANGTYGIAEYGVAVNYLASDGISAADKHNGNNEADGYRNFGASANLRLKVMDDINLDIRVYHTSARSDIDGFPPPAFAFGDTPEFVKNDLTAGYAGLNVDSMDGRLHNRIALIASQSDRRFFGEFGFAPPFDFTPAENNYARGSTVRIEYQGTFDVDNDNQVTLGAESQRTTFNTMSLQFDVAPTLGARRTTSGYAQWQTTLFDQLTLTAGVRTDNDSQFGSHASLKFAGAWSLPELGTVVHVNYGDGFKAPSLYELYSQYSNPLTALKPETARGYEAGVAQTIWNGRIKAMATWFSRKTKNQIDFFSCPFTPPFPPGCDTRPFGFYYNIGRTRSQGVEFDLASALSETVTAAFNLTDMASQDLDLHTDLARRPRITLGGSLFWSPLAGSSLGVTLSHIGHRFDGAGEVRPLPGYTLVNILGAYPLANNFSLFARVENLFNAHYEPVAGYGAAGRAAYAGIRANL